MTNVSHANTSLFSRLPVPQASPPYKRIHRTCCVLLRSYCKIFASYSQSQEDLAKRGAYTVSYTCIYGFSRICGYALPDHYVFFLICLGRGDGMRMSSALKREMRRTSTPNRLSFSRVSSRRECCAARAKCQTSL